MQTSLSELKLRWVLLGLSVVSVIGLPFVSDHAHAARTSVEDMSSFTQFPVVGTSASVAPQVVLNVSRDHQLFYKAYNDYTDLDGNGTLETTYTHSIDYYGYFDSYKCYNYDTANNRFAPSSITNNKYCSGAWSGNFLNWVTMSRMDATRKLLIGGLRSTDTSSLTVLERAHLPGDGHSWAKYYNGPDIENLTPFDPPTTSSPVSVTFASDVRVGPYSPDTASTPGWNTAPYNAAPHTAVLNFPLAGVTTYQIGDQVRIEVPSYTDTFMVGGVTAVNGTSTVSIRIDPDSVVFNGQPANPTNTAFRNAVTRNFTLTNLTRTGISFCNTNFSNASDGLSQNDTSPPLLRVAQGNYDLWAANEQVQCKWFDERSNSQGSFYAAFRSNGNRALLSGLNASGENARRTAASPYASVALGSGQSAGQFVVRVEACRSTMLGTERCKRYPGGNYKPIGLLQQYGDEGDLKFALFTPTWAKNVTGGVLRKGMADMRDEVNTTTDGTFKNFQGLVFTLNKLRIVNYNASTGNNYGANDGCSYQRTGIGNGLTDAVAEGKCSSWGNPMSELYAESLRYLAGSTATSAMAPGTSGGDTALGLPTPPTWTDPISPSLYCSPLNVLNFNASVSSYDWNGVPTTGLAGSPNAVALTSTVGTTEGLSGSVFIGENGSTDDNLCSIKAFGSLGAARGLCPEAPALEGSYLMAGLAWWAKTNKIRSTPAVPSTDRQSLKVTTYGIQLATNTPKIEIPVGGGRKVSILPAYRLDKSSNGSGPFGGGAIVDFRVVSLDVANGRGKFYVNWEDSAQGGDYDQDMWGTITYEVLNSGAQVKITTDAVSASTNAGQGFGYVISGTTKDGPHFHSGIYDFDFTDPSSPQVFVGSVLANGTSGYINVSGGCTNCKLTDPPTSVTYDVSSSGAQAKLLNDPLWFAAKYGGFTDSNNNNIPDLQSEWDTRNVAGDPTPDGIPDTYFLVTNPGALEDSLSRVFQAILSKTSSGTAAAVVANSSRGFGAVYQALFEQRRSDANAREARWLGDLQGIWIDSAGYLREDINANKRLDNYSVDPVIQFYFDPNVQPPRARYKRLTNTSANPDEFVAGPVGGDGLPPGTTLELEDLKTLWNARKTLAALSSSGLDVQRTYTTAAETGRHILTWVDSNYDGNLSQSEVLPFVWGTGGFGSSNKGFLNSNDNTEAQNIVNWVRGVEVAGFRNRLLDYSNTGTPQVLRFGDVVNSTPSAAGSPAEAFNLLYNDDSYTEFSAAYTPRRQMVYVGANDGMLHAFHGGFFDQRQLRFARSAGTAPAHQLGAEMWAYVPGNLLPHLRWLTDSNYTHVFYVDGSPYVFDANVFSSDSTHVQGWGTLLAVNFRTGGGNIRPDTANDGLGAANSDGNPTDDLLSRAATVLLDVTNPEAAPKVLAEIPVDEGWQLGRPTVAAFRDINGSTNKFFLIVPSGPNKELSGRIVSDRAFKIRVYDLAQLANGVVSPVRTLDGPAGSGDLSFAMDPVSADYDLDYKAEAIYFGTVKAPATGVEFTGSLFKVNTGESANPASWSIQLVHDTQRPITIRPTLGLDDKNERYVYVGTGRLLSGLDTDSAVLQRIYGIKDRSISPNTVGGLPTTGLVDVSSVSVTAGGLVNGSTQFNDYLATFDAAGGWYRNLAAATTLGGSERVVSNQALVSGLLLTTTYVPSKDLCANLGTSNLFVLNYKAGVASPSMANAGSGTPPSSSTVVNPSTALGPGVPSAPTIAIGQGQGSRSSRACSQTSTGAIICQDLESEQLSRSGESSWRQPSN